MSRFKLLILSLAVAVLSVGTASYLSAARAVAGGDCANTICGGVTYCNYGSGYTCSLTSDSCTNKFCSATSIGISPEPVLISN